jgi:5,10-methylenetetrahydromethanopterin reductase
MEIGLALPHIDDPEPFRQQVQTAERLGIHALWTYDSGRGADPFASSGYLAAVTSHVQICCGILNPFLRHPALLTSGAATVDRLSGGAAGSSSVWAGHRSSSACLALSARARFVIRRRTSRSSSVCCGERK